MTFSYWHADRERTPDMLEHAEHVCSLFQTSFALRKRAPRRAGAQRRRSACERHSALLAHVPGVRTGFCLHLFRYIGCIHLYIQCIKYTKYSKYIKYTKYIRYTKYKNI